VLRLAALALLGAMPLAPVEAAQVTIQANANVVKALTFTSKQDLDFGTVMPAASGTTTVSMSMAGAITCPATATCTGAARPAIFNVQGTNKGTVRVIAAASDLVNAANGSTMRFTPAAPATVTLTNSGAPGTDFNVGGSIAIPSTADGTYVGNIEITVDYQ
jgi:Mat/Ecp fimbriae major subunit